MNRRRAIALLSVASFSWKEAFASESRSLNLYCPHTGERCFVEYFNNGSYLQDGLLEIYYLMRDRRTGHIRKIDTRVLDTLHTTLLNLDRKYAQIHILSGYRTSKTNALLARTSHSVAKNSYHMKGQAVDCLVPGTSTANFRAAARNSSDGGIGYYPDSNFIHIDSGPKRDWVA